MKIPYGMSNYRDVITQGYVYVDKTQYIQRLEETGKYQLLLRPRRFGKSLFISMLEYYYDVLHADAFETLFGPLQIGQQPTPLRNSYQPLFIEFTGIQTDCHDTVYEGFNLCVEMSIRRYWSRYADSPLPNFKDLPSPQAKIKHFFNYAEEHQHRVLILIDEYDHFANALLAEDQQHFQRIVGKGGFVRSFYETIKAATQRGIVDRLFITGVTPLMLDSLTSGFNIVQNLSLNSDFNAAMGFTREETAALLQPLVDQCQLDTEQLMGDVKAWYNGYRFHEDAVDNIYNSDMVMYFINRFNVKSCEYPEQMLDENIASDYGKIMALFNIGDRKINQQVLDELIRNDHVLTLQQRKFELAKSFDRDDFISLLAYMGFVTVKEKVLLRTAFSIPNHVIRELYFQYFKVELERRYQLKIHDQTLGSAIDALALNNDFSLMQTEMENVLQGLSNRDAIGMDEKHLKVMLLTLLFQFPVYFIQSEPEKNRRYPDIMLLERSPYEVKHQHLIELKYCKKGDGESGWQAKREQGLQQVREYLQLPQIAALPKLSAWLLVSDGERVEIESVTAI